MTHGHLPLNFGAAQGGQTGTPPASQNSATATGAGQNGAAANTGGGQGAHTGNSGGASAGSGQGASAASAQNGTAGQGQGQPPPGQQANPLPEEAVAALQARILDLERQLAERVADNAAANTGPLFMDQANIDKLRAAAASAAGSAEEKKLKLPAIILGHKASPLDLREYRFHTFPLPSPPFFLLSFIFVATRSISRAPLTRTYCTCLVSTQ